jgi:hypothetical protein
MRIECPRCRQDYIVKAHIKPTGQDICVCPECDAFWWPGEEITLESFKQYQVYLVNMGYEDHWNHLDVSNDYCERQD